MGGLGGGTRHLVASPWPGLSGWSSGSGQGQGLSAGGQGAPWSAHLLKPLRGPSPPRRVGVSLAPSSGF